MRRGAAAFKFSFEVFRFVLAQGERLEISSSVVHFAVLFKKITRGNFLDSIQSIITFEKLICCSCFITFPKATTQHDYTTAVAFMAEWKHYPGFVVLQKPVFGLKIPLDF